MASVAEGPPELLRARRPTAESDDSDPDLEKGGDGVAEPLLHHNSKPHASPVPHKISANATATTGVCEPQTTKLQLQHEAGRLDVVKSVVAIVVWYTSNIGLLLLNKFMLSDFGFRRPVFLTLWHMMACSVLSGVLAATGFVPVQHITSSRQFGKVAVLALVFCISVVLGNVSLRYIPVSFNQAIGATTPLFTAGIAFLILGERETHRVYMALIPVVLGIVIATGAEPSFQLLGFLAAIGATASRAFKSILQGLLLTDASEKLDSMNLLRYMTPIASGVLMLMVMVMEADVSTSLPAMGDENWLWFYTVLGANGILAFMVNLTNFLVTRYTSALTLQVLGNGKGVIAVVVSILIFQNPWTLSSIGGYGIAAAGVAWFMHEKTRQAQSSGVNNPSNTRAQ